LIQFSHKMIDLLYRINGTLLKLMELIFTF